MTLRDIRTDEHRRAFRAGSEILGVGVENHLLPPGSSPLVSSMHTQRRTRQLPGVLFWPSSAACYFENRQDTILPDEKSNWLYLKVTEGVSTGGDPVTVSRLVVPDNETPALRKGYVSRKSTKVESSQ